VANAVMDGADACLLGADTLRGTHLVLTPATDIYLLTISERKRCMWPMPSWTAPAPSCGRGDAATGFYSENEYRLPNRKPCRAEATDVANAVMDGADAFLLGAETLRGTHPVLTVSTILSIARQAEAVFDHTHHFDHLMAVRTAAPCFVCTIVCTRVPDSESLRLVTGGGGVRPHPPLGPPHGDAALLSLLFGLPQRD